MNESKPTLYDELRELAQSESVATTLERLIKTLREQGDFHPLFEALKMQTRHRIGLPILYDQRPTNLTPQQQDQLEDGLLESCREVGTLLVQAGKLREGWMYLQPIDDSAFTRKLIESYPANDDNMDEVIDIALMQLAAPAVGYSLILERYGTCNAITSFDSCVHSLDTPTKKELAKLLIDHLYSELLSNLKGYLSEQQISYQKDDGFLNLVRANKQVLTGAGPMTDATHLSSTMRIGRHLEDTDSIQKLAEMAEYGCQLAEPFHFPGDPPFEKTYRDHLTFYRALLATDPESPEVKQAVQIFDQKSRSSSIDEHNPIPDEVFVDLLFRLGMRKQAIEASLERLGKRAELTGIAPMVYQIAESPEHFSILEKHYQNKQDLLGFTVSVLLQNDAAEA